MTLKKLIVKKGSGDRLLNASPKKYRGQNNKLALEKEIKAQI